jgi:hypothetical protein
MDTLVIEVEGEPAVYIQMEPPPELIFEVEGIQGPTGASDIEAGDAIKVVGDVVHVDINRLTFAP